MAKITKADHQLLESFFYQNIICFNWVMSHFLSSVTFSVKKVSFPAKTAVYVNGDVLILSLGISLAHKVSQESLTTQNETGSNVIVPYLLFCLSNNSIWTATAQPIYSCHHYLIMCEHIDKLLYATAILANCTYQFWWQYAIILVWKTWSSALNS